MLFDYLLHVELILNIQNTLFVIFYASFLKNFIAIAMLTNFYYNKYKQLEIF